MSISNRSLCWLLIVFVSVLVCACSPPQVKVNLSSTANLNMNDAAVPLPVVVRVYQLTDPVSFENATFHALWKNDLTTLGNNLLRKDTLTIDPASQRKVEFERHEQTRFIGVMAAFNNQPDDSWRVVHEVDGSFLGIDISTRIKIILKDNVIEILD